MEKKNVQCVRGEVAMIAMKLGSQWASYDYRVAQIDQNDGRVTPFKSGETVMVPLRAVVEGFKGTYEEAGAQFKAEMRGVVLEGTAGAANVTVVENGAAQTVVMPAEAVVEKENVFLPLETVGDAFGLFTAYYPDENHAKDVLVLSKKDLSAFSSPLKLYPVECLLNKVKGLREYVSMEVPKVLYELANLSPVTGFPAKDAVTSHPDYFNKNAELYPATEVFSPKEGVPKGTVTKGHMDDCKTYPEIQHDYWVYVPAQYDGTTPAKLLIMTTGEQYFDANGPKFGMLTMLDNMIHEGKLPVTIVLFVSCGHIGSGNPVYGVTSVWDSNFSPELDSTDERYSNFIVHEVMPTALKGLNISENKYDRAIYGMSSGAPGAMGVAWNNNDAVGTVIAVMGSFTNIRGGFVWPYALRREHRDIRVFYLASPRDANLVFGNWYSTALSMASALEYGGYEYVFAIGKSGHMMSWPVHLLPGILEWAFLGKPFHHEHVKVTSGKIDEMFDV